LIMIKLSYCKSRKVTSLTWSHLNITKPQIWGPGLDETGAVVVNIGHYPHNNDLHRTMYTE